MFAFLWWILVGLVAGWLTGKIMGGGKGVFGDILLGIGGALIGGWIMRLLGGTGHGGTIYTILVATGGAVLLTWLYRLITRKSGGSGSGNIRRAA
jgi:uncharacterized membrane protein YeaQ/YmgE (transglycosylase-associated protein family)